MNLYRVWTLNQWNQVVFDLIKYGYYHSESEIYRLPGHIVIKRQAQIIDWEKERRKHAPQCPLIQKRTNKG